MDAEKYAVIMAAAAAHGMLKVLVETDEISSYHQQQARMITNELAEALWPGEASKKVEKPNAQG